MNPPRAQPKEPPIRPKRTLRSRPNVPARHGVGVSTDPLTLPRASVVTPEEFLKGSEPLVPIRLGLPASSLGLVAAPPRLVA